MKTARESRKKRLKEKVQARKDREQAAIQEQTAREEKKAKKAASKERQKAKAAPVHPTPIDDQTVCRRKGCYNTDGFKHGLCFKCYDKLRDCDSEDSDKTKTVQREHQVTIGQLVLIAESYIQSVYRGLYATVINLEDNDNIAVVELTGDGVAAALSREQTAALKARHIRLLVDHLLLVEE